MVLLVQLMKRKLAAKQWYLYKSAKIQNQLLSLLEAELITLFLKLSEQLLIHAVLLHLLRRVVAR